MQPFHVISLTNKQHCKGGGRKCLVLPCMWGSACRDVWFRGPGPRSACWDQTPSLENRQTDSADPTQPILSCPSGIQPEQRLSGEHKPVCTLHGHWVFLANTLLVRFIFQPRSCSPHLGDIMSNPSECTEINCADPTSCDKSPVTGSPAVWWESTASGGPGKNPLKSRMWGGNCRLCLVSKVASLWFSHA